MSLTSCCFRTTPQVWFSRTGKGNFRMFQQFQEGFSHQTFHVEITNLLRNVLWGLGFKFCVGKGCLIPFPGICCPGQALISHCVSSNHLTAPNPSKIPSNPNYSRALGTVILQPHSRLGLSLLSRKRIFPGVPQKLLHAPRSYSLCLESSSRISCRAGKVERTENPNFCGSGRARLCPCHPVTLSQAAGVCQQVSVPWGQELSHKAQLRAQPSTETLQMGQTQLENVLHCKARRFQLLLPNYM